MSNHAHCSKRDHGSNSRGMHAYVLHMGKSKDFETKDIYATTNDRGFLAWLLGMGVGSIVEDDGITLHCNDVYK